MSFSRTAVLCYPLEVSDILSSKHCQSAFFSWTTLYATQYKELYEDVLVLVNNLEAGLDAVENSEAFRQVLKVVLQLGNFLNYKTRLVIVLFLHILARFSNLLLWGLP